MCWSKNVRYSTPTHTLNKYKLVHSFNHWYNQLFIHATEHFDLKAHSRITQNCKRNAEKNPHEFETVHVIFVSYHRFTSNLYVIFIFFCRIINHWHAAMTYFDNNVSISRLTANNNKMLCDWLCACIWKYRWTNRLSKCWWMALNISNKFWLVAFFSTSTYKWWALSTEIMPQATTFF